jgi:hypothetical protein
MEQQSQPPEVSSIKVKANMKPNSTRPNMAISKGNSCTSARAILKLPQLLEERARYVWLRAPQ